MAEQAQEFDAHLEAYLHNEMNAAQPFYIIYISNLPSTRSLPQVNMVLPVEQMSCQMMLRQEVQLELCMNRHVSGPGLPQCLGNLQKKQKKLQV